MTVVSKAINGTMWSYAAEIIAKVINPLSFLILTRILSPEDYGVVAVATTLLMFIDIICDLGTSKVIIQLKSSVEKDFDNYCDAAFGINIILGIVLFSATELFASQIADYYSQPKSEAVIRVMAIQIICYSLSSIQTSLLRKSLLFNYLFWIRLITIACPILIAIPIAFCGGGMWAIVCSSCAGSVLQCAALWRFSKWRPSFTMRKSHLQELVGQSVWNSINQLAIWVPISFDTYLISKYISSADLGLYNSARALFTAASGLILSPILPVAYSALSKAQNKNEFDNIAYNSQKILFTLSALFGLIFFVFGEYITPIIFNKEWIGITVIVQIVFLIMGYEYFGSIIQEAIRAKGQFKQLAIISIISLIMVVPILYLAAETGSVKTYTMARSFSLYIPMIGVFILANKDGILFRKCISNNATILILTFVVILCTLLIDRYFANWIFQVILKVIVCLICTCVFCLRERRLIQKIRGIILSKLKRRK